MAVTDKTLVASSEFDPTTFVQGIDAMTGALEKLAAQEDAIKSDLKNIDTALKANRAELKATTDQINALDKASKTYTEDLAKLNAQQTTLKTQQAQLKSSLAGNRESLGQINTAAINYKNTLQGIGDVTKKIAADNKGRTIFDIAGLNQQVQQITQLSGRIRNAFQGKISTDELEQFEEALAGTNDEFQQLAQVLDFVKSKMNDLDPNSSEFADLNQIISTGQQVLDEYNNSLDQTDKKSGSLRARLAAMRAELVKLEDQGKENTEEFQALQIEAGKLQDSISDAQQRIKVLASDTKNLDFGIGAIRGVASAFGIAEGSAALFGLKQEDVTESLQRLNSIMLILNGLQEVQNLLQKQSVVYIVGQEIATKALVISQRVLAATLGTTAAASRALNVALIGTGIGAFLVLIGLVVSALSEWANAAKEVTLQQKLLNAEIDTAVKLSNDEIEALEDANKLIRSREQLRQENARKAGQTDRQQLEERAANNERLRAIDEKTLVDQIEASRQLEARERQAFENASNRRRDMLENRVKFNEDEFKELEKTIESFSDLQERGNQLENRLNIQRNLNDADRAKERAEIRELEYTQTQDFLKRLEDLRNRLTDARNSRERQDAAQLQRQAAESLRRELRAIDQDVKTGKISSARAEILKDLLKQISGVETAQVLKEFNKQATDAAQALEDQITQIRFDAADQRVALIQDDLTRQTAEIKVAGQRQAEELTNQRREALRGVSDAFEQGLINEAQATQNAARITQIYDRLFNYLANRQAQAAEEVARQTFAQVQEETQRVFSNVTQFVTAVNTQEIIKLAQLFNSGKISYDKYQRELTEILNRESSQRIAQAIRENNQLLAGVQARIQAETDPDRLEDLRDEETRLKQSISELERQLAQADVAETKADQEAFDAKLARLSQYAQAIGNVATQAAQFWAQLNEAEQAQLERSIALQEQRVEAATRIAERGNAEYLRLEEDRLNELRVQQENAARRQLAINAILQTSQALTAFVSALAQGIATGGPIGGLTVAAAVIAAIASGYSIIQSLQNDNVQRFYKGTKSVDKGENADGVDTVPAMLTPGEAVIPKDTNRDYHPAVAAIYDRSIPADAMNNFVNSYRVNSRILPRLSGEKIGEAAKSLSSYDAKLLAVTEAQTQKMAEHSELLRETNRRLASMGVSVNVDRHGLAVSLMKAVDKHHKDKKA